VRSFSNLSIELLLNFSQTLAGDPGDNSFTAYNCPKETWAVEIDKLSCLISEPVEAYKEQ